MFLNTQTRTTDTLFQVRDVINERPKFFFQFFQSERSDSAPCSIKENYSAPTFSIKPYENDEENVEKKSKNVEKMSNNVENMSTNLENRQILVKEDLDTESKNCERTKRRAPKLSALRAATNGTFSKPLVMTRLDDSIKLYNL